MTTQGRVADAGEAVNGPVMMNSRIVSESHRVEEAAAETAAGRRSFFADYRAPAGKYDELQGAACSVAGKSTSAAKPPLQPKNPSSLGDTPEPWKRLDRALTEVGRESFGRLWTQTRHALRENGIAYGSPGQFDDRSRPWQLDPIPLVLAAKEWEQISAALQQRARLLNHIVTDLLGPQRLITDGLLPAEVVFRHPMFHRSLWHEGMAARMSIMIYAADIARDQQGEWWVLGDRTEAPSGLGFALENRLLTSRMLPSAFHRLQVCRLASFFMDLRDAIARLADPQLQEDPSQPPRVVLLTRGESSARYFEDAFLSRYLGYTLAEGQDLAVRDNRLVFKTLRGLLPVDVVLRRPDSRTLDPLEIISGQYNGTAGLLQAWRIGQVGMANPPGAGIVESPVMMSFLPFLCQEIFGEPLKMPAVATWWLGAEAIRKKVLRRLDDVIIRPAFERPGPAANAESARLMRLPKEQLLDLIHARPYDFVAQERVERSSMPVWSGANDPLVTTMASERSGHSELQAGNVVVRAFQLQHAPDEFQTMQGGLVRVEPVEEGSADELCKDLWILSDQPVRHVSLLDQNSTQIELRRGGAELPSRVAENLFWVGRHLERTEAVARLLRSVVVRLTGEDEATQLPEMSMLLRGMVEQNQIEPDYVVPDILGTLRPLEQVLPQLVCDPEHHGGLRSRIDTLMRTTMTVRDRISADSWRAIRKVGDVFAEIDAATASLPDTLELANETILSLTAFSGLASESMTRTTTWRFLDLGRRLERASQSASILRCACELPSTHSSATFVALLENAESLMTYRSRYQSGFRWGPVCDLLICDSSNPRSVAYQLAAIVDHIQRLPEELSRSVDAELNAAAVEMLHLVEALNPASLQGAEPVRRLSELLAVLDQKLPKFSDAINHAYFVHTPRLRTLGGLEVSSTSSLPNVPPYPSLSSRDDLDPTDWSGGAI